MKVFLSLFLCLFAFNVYAEKIYWYLGAAMTNPGKAITRKYNKLHNNKVILITGGSGQILNKMVLSEKGDVYSPTNGKYYKKAKEQGTVIKGEKLIVQTPVFGISKKAENNITVFKHLANPGVRLALGNPKTMALGKTYKIIKQRLPETIAEGIMNNKTVEAANISQIVNYVKISTVDAGIMFDSVARLNNLKYVEIPEKYNVKVTAFISLSKYTKNRDLAESFIEFVRKNRSIFAEYGYNVVMGDKAE